MAVSKRYGLITDLEPVSDEITHGSQITTSNTGWNAYYDAVLGRTLLLSDLETVTGPKRPSDFVSAGGTIRKVRFTGDIRIDRTDVTFEACLFEDFVRSYLNGTETYPTNFSYCAWDPPGGAAVGDLAVGTIGTNLTRCRVRGSADATWINGQPGGTQNIIESHLRVKMASGVDHNDGCQNSGGSGTVNVLRCNIDMNPEGGVLGGGGGPNACIMSADMSSGTTFHLNVENCWLDGAESAEALRLYDGGLTTNITYRAVGNRFVRNTGKAAMGRGSSNTTPSNQVEWSNNVWDDDDEVIAKA